jgi:competence protein ComEA
MDGWLERHREAIVSVLVTLLVSAIGLGTVIFSLRRQPPAPIVIRSMALVPTHTRTPTATPGPIRVYVSGAVAVPGVYSLAWDSRVDQAIAAAGGAAAAADLIQVNLAQRLSDGEQVHVPAHGEVVPPQLSLQPARKTATARPPSADRRINVNTANGNQLEALPGIGPALAQRILDYRQANGPFARPEDIKKVKGIGDSIFEQIKELITIE